jgi:hypothetical protein
MGAFMADSISFPEAAHLLKQCDAAAAQSMSTQKKVHHKIASGTEGKMKRRKDADSKRV